MLSVQDDSLDRGISLHIGRSLLIRFQCILTDQVRAFSLHNRHIPDFDTYCAFKYNHQKISYLTEPHHVVALLVLFTLHLLHYPVELLFLDTPENIKFTLHKFLQKQNFILISLMV